MKISITNIVALNGGDAAIAYGMAKALKSRYGNDLELRMFASYPSVCQKLYPEFEWQKTLGLSGFSTRYNHVRYLGRIARSLKEFRYLLAARTIRINKSLAKLLLNEADFKAMLDYATSDYIVSTGGTYLIEPYGIGTQYLDYRISLALGRKLGFYTQSMGPFYHQSTIEHLSSVFSHADFMFFRDQKSKNNVDALELTERPIMKVVADAAFALGDIELIKKRTFDRIGEKKKVAISVRHFIDSKLPLENYCKAIAHTIHHLVCNNYEVHFFSTCQGIPEYDDDTKVASQVLSHVLPEDMPHIVNTTCHIPIPELMSRLESMDFIIATRLHMSILSLIVGTPVIPIAYEFKSEELFHSLGYENVIKMEHVANDSLLNTTKAFMQEYDKGLRADVNKRVISLINESMNVPLSIK